MPDASERVDERGLLTASDRVWGLAKRRAEVIGALAADGVVSVDAADTAAVELGITRRHVYTLVRRWRCGTGVVSDMLPGRSGGGAGSGRLAEPVEAVVRDVLHRKYLARQRPSAAVVYREITQTCRSRGLRVPSYNAVARRIARLDPVVSVRRREGADAARSRVGAGGVAPVVEVPLAQVQMDHTVVDVIVVDEQHRLPIGRPYVTVAIDVYSRSIVGMVLTLEAPSATSVGLCLAHMVTDKRPWLERVGLAVSWPMSGKPVELYLDNAAEFHSEALNRGCDQHGIELRYRPLGQPHYGGIVERVIGTLMSRVHELPGTTFSNPAQRGDYDCDASACLTMGELERWLALAVCSYHGQVHGTTGQTPAALWAAGTAERSPTTVTNEASFLVDFLPVVRRTLTRTGFVIDRVHYYSDALRPWIARRETLGRFVIRRDPRDISRIWVLDPDDNAYLQVPYRTMSHPAVSVWEHAAALARLRELGRSQVDEATLFGMIDQMRQITAGAQTSSRKARRQEVRSQGAGHLPQAADALGGVPPSQCPPDDPGAACAAPFEDIEQW